MVMEIPSSLCYHGKMGIVQAFFGNDRKHHPDPCVFGGGMSGVCSQDILEFCLDSFKVAANRADSLMDFEDFVGNVDQ